jgi:hypothetical protein
VALQPAWQVIRDPLTTGVSWSYFGPVNKPSGHSCVLSGPEVDTPADRCRAIAAAHTKKLDLTVRRLLSTMADRHDPVNKLIDAVIAWEDLFGSTEGETTMRVSVSLARLLASSPDQREMLCREAKDIYRTCSKIVHGNEPPDNRTANEKGIRAIVLGLRALGMLYDERNDLIALDSAARSNKLLIDGSVGIDTSSAARRQIDRRRGAHRAARHRGPAPREQPVAGLLLITQHRSAQRRTP